ncbi:MAG TPA: Gfo/Idh/MocA family oxidoreductase, partial [Opitutaceae bacterium]|nr:Gfo/Idh/MocA family oxidoreductase [Opitutaceae bacterium]
MIDNTGNSGVDTRGRCAMLPVNAMSAAPNLKSTAGPRVAVVGCGYWGRNLVRNFHALGALAAVADGTEPGRKLAAELAPGVEVVPEFESLLGRSDLDAIVLATPAVTHGPLGVQALAAGKDLFVEKPMALSLKDGRELVKLAARHGRMLQVGHVLEYHPAVNILRDWIQSGKLGRIGRLHSHRLNFGRVRTEEDALWNVAPHDFAVMLRITGQLPEEVSCFASYPLRTARADFAIAMLRFPNAVDAHVFAGWLHPTKEQRLVVVGERGVAVFDDAAPLEQKLVFYDQRVDLSGPQPQLHKGVARAEPLPPDEPLRVECLAFLESIRTRRPPLSDGQSGLRVLAVLDACRRSTDHG